MKTFILFCFIIGSSASFPPAHAQPVLASKIVPLPTVDYGSAGYVIQQWTFNSIPQAQQVTTNWITKAVVVSQSPKNGGTVTNHVATFTLVTNRVTVLSTNGAVYAFTLMEPAQRPWEAFEIVNLETTTNLEDSSSWRPVGWDTRCEPRRFFRVNGTNTVQSTVLYLHQVTFTNQP